MKEAIFKFVFKDRVIPVQPFDKLMNISKRIRNTLIFSYDHTYMIESKVQEENINKFIEYLISNEENGLEITINNINDYEALSEEFEIIKEEIERKKEEYGEYLILILGLEHEDKNMKEKYENEISSKLDEYIERYGEELMNQKIENLYNIFTQAAGKFEKHDEIYEHIQKHFERTNDSNIFILLDFLDGSRMKRQYIEESFSLCSAPNSHMPRIEYSTLNEYFEKQRKLEDRFNEYSTKQEEEKRKYERSMKEHILKLEYKIDELIMNNETIIQTNDKLRTKIEKNETKIQQLEEQQTKTNEYINELQLKNEELNNKRQYYEKNLENNFQEERKEIEYLKSHIDQLENNNINQESQNEEQNSKISTLEKQIKELKQRKIAI